MHVEFPTRFNIRTRMLLLCLGVAAPLLAIGSFSLWKEYRTLKQEAQRATTFQAAISVRTLGQWTKAQLSTVRAIASIHAVQQMNLETSKKVIATALQAQPFWTEVTLFNATGEPVLSTTAVPATKKISVQLASFPFYNKVTKAKGPTVSGYEHAPISGKAAILVGAPVLANGELQGVLVAAIDPKAVLNLFLGLGENNGNIVAVVDDTKRVVARTLQNDYWEGKDFSHAKSVTAASKATRGNFEAVGIADPTARAYAFDRVPETGWLVVVGVPTDAIYGAAHDWLFIMTCLAGCAIGISVGLAFLVTSHFTSTIHVLVREALAIGRGDLTKRVHVPAKDELGLLARAFNQMATQLEVGQDQKAMIEKLSESIRQSLDINEILNTTVRELGQALSASRCCLALLDTKDTADISDDELVFNHVWWDEKFGGAALQNKIIRITKDSVMQMIIEQGSILSLDVLDDRGPTPLFENSKDSPDDWRSIKSLIACPITTKNGALGLILVHQCDSLRVWSDHELELVEAVTRHVTLAMEHARLYNRTKTMAEQELLINHIVRSVRSSLDLDTILNTVTQELGKALGADRIQIAQPRSEGPLVVTHEFHLPHMTDIKGLNMYSDSIDFHPNIGLNRILPGNNTLLGINLDEIMEASSPEDEWGSPSPSGTTLREAPIAVINNVFEDSRTLPFKDFLDTVSSQSMIAAPLLHENRLVGLLMVHQCETSRTWNSSEVQLVAAIADQVAIAITHAHLFAQVKHQAITDGLTGLYNHIYFKNRLSEEIRLAKRKSTSCSLLMIDLDKLKMINDKFGHPVGDAAIRQIGAILKTLLRSGDTAARYGGEEFAIILPETTLLEAALIADRLCSQIRNTPVPGLGRITTSIGVASYPKHALEMAELIENADKALYVAKNSGRDQVRLYESEPTAVDLGEGVVFTPPPPPTPSVAPSLPIITPVVNRETETDNKLNKINKIRN
ncbi:MAG: diguanylate cyclase [Cyanobacteria bacterium SZAS-4]|nr:diguanylate cyclase [Cyanobacteria bacterium SZAS-4]